MNSLTITTQQQGSSFRPGEQLNGTVSWKIEAQPKSAQVRLFWYTGGKGTRDVEIVDSIIFQTPKESDERSFSFKLPDAPYSFSGKLISLIWAIELILEPGGHAERLQIIVSPTGEEILLRDPANALSVL